MSIPKIATYALPPQSQWPLPRTDWLPSSQRAVLLIHDMQDYFVQFYDRTAQPMPEVIAHIQQLRQACQSVGIPIVYTAQPAVQAVPDRALLQDWWGPGITAQPDQASVIVELTPTPQDVVLTKWRYSAFARSDLQDRMRAWGRDQLIVCGIYAHIGCMTTCVDAFMRDIQPFFLADGVADFSLADHQMALDYVATRCGKVIPCEEVLALAPASASAAQSNPLLTYEGLKARLLSHIDEDEGEFDPDENLIDYGLDSVRIMALLTEWRAAGVELGFVDLAKLPTLNGWWRLIEAKLAAQALEVTP